MVKRTLATLLIAAIATGTVAEAAANRSIYSTAVGPIPAAVGGTVLGPAPERTPVGPHAVTLAYPPGVAGITPSLQVTLASEPAFTQADVEHYLATAHPFQAASPDGGKLAKAVFVPSSTASAYLGGEWIGRPAADLVCYVEVAGPLVPEMASIPPGLFDPSMLKPASKGILVFDAQTGNLLIRGFM